jgi:hypothetical protein
VGLSPRDRRTASSSFGVPFSCSPRRWPRPKHWRKCFALLLKAISRPLVSFNLLDKTETLAPRLTAILSHATAELANLTNFEVVEN